MQNLITLSEGTYRITILQHRSGFEVNKLGLKAEDEVGSCLQVLTG